LKKEKIMPQKPKKQARKKPQTKSASLDRLIAALALPADTPEEALVASTERVEELLLHQKQFDRLLRQAIAEGNGEVIFRLKATMIRTTSMIEAYRIDMLIAGDMVRRFEAQRKEIERLEGVLGVQ
jgi:hypothetical protein